MGRKPYDVNVRSVIAFGEIGKGPSSIQSFCHSINMPPINKFAYDKTVNNLHDIYIVMFALI